MSAPTLQELADRVAAIEDAVAKLRNEGVPAQKKGWQAVVGMFADDPEMKEIFDLGKQIRDSEPPDFGYSLEMLREDRVKILELAARHGAHNIRVFGSVARGDAGVASDIDLLVDFEPQRSLLDQAGLKIDLEELFRVRVDVATVAGLKPRIRERVLREAVSL